jgi:glycosyltransferase involved in cell wall biosynthesis
MIEDRGDCLLGLESQPGVAVIVPCYNAQATLAATLGSALPQTGIQDIVVVDDGSTDDTLAVARSYEPSVRVLTGPNGGVSAARNRGIAATTAEWLLFLDADDLLTPGTIANRLETARACNADVVISDWEDATEGGDDPGRIGQQRSVDWRALTVDAEVAIATDVWTTTAAILYRRSVVQRVGGFRIDLPMVEDARFLFDAAYHGARFAHSAHVGAQYRVRSGSLSRSNPACFWECVLRNGQQIEALWRARKTFGAARRQAAYAIYNNACRGLFAAAHPSYFAAVEAQRGLGLPLPRHSHVAAPLARVLGLRAARAVLHALGRK